MSAYGMEQLHAAPITGIPLIQGVPAHLRTQLFTAPVSPYSFLKGRQRTMHPVLPIHTAPEFKLFNELLNSEQFHTKSSRSSKSSVNFKSMAHFWNKNVHTLFDDPDFVPSKANTLYYKIPEQLERHFKVWEALRVERATLTISESARKTITDVLTDPWRRSQVLPAVPLLSGTGPGGRTDKGKQKEILPGNTTGMEYNLNLTCNSINVFSVHLHDTPIMSSPIPSSPNTGTMLVESDTTEHQQVTTSAIPQAMEPEPSLFQEAINPQPAPSITSVQRGQPNQVKKRAKRRCGACRDYDCPRVDVCRGSGGAGWCTCVHEGPRPSRKRRRA